LTNALVARGFAVLPSAANFIFASPAHTNTCAAELFKHLNNRDVLVRYWSEAPIDQWLRISIGSDAETDRLLLAIDDLVQPLT